MKKFIYSILIAFIGISCSQSDDFMDNPFFEAADIPQTLFGEIPYLESRAAGLYDTQPESWNETDRNESRTIAVIDPNTIHPDIPTEYFQYWSEGDAISLFFTTHNLKYKLVKTSEPDRGTFVLDSDPLVSYELTSDSYYSVYPYKDDNRINTNGIIKYTFPETQYYYKDSYANGINGMIAKEEIESADGILEFKNFCSYLQVNLAHPNTEATPTSNVVKRIVLMSNDENVKISGIGYISYIDNNNRQVPVVNMHESDLSRRRITLDCGDGVEISRDLNNPTTFWFVLPGGIEFTGGFNITILFSDGTNFRKNTSKTINIERNHIKPMVPFSTVNNVPESSLRYKLKDSEAGPYPLGNSFYNGKNKLNIISHKKDSVTGEYVVNFEGTLDRIGGNNFKVTSPEIEYIKINNNAPLTIDAMAFYNCNADYVDIFNEVKVIKGQAFSSCNVKDFNIYADVQKIESYVMGTQDGIENLNIYGKVNELSHHAFAGTEISTIFIENEITNIGDYAFYDCTNLTSVYLPKLINIGNQAFQGCIKLNSIKLDYIENIGTMVFYDCHSLQYVEISANCKNIGEGAFCQCTSLTSIYCYSKVPPVLHQDDEYEESSFSFDTENPNTRIYIPKGTINSYREQIYWTEYKDIISEI